MTASETRNIPDFPLFDWLRIAMAGMVVASHFGLVPWDYAPNLAVQVFFALSGWLIGGILLGMGSNKLPLFYFNRTTRVWIPYFVTVVLLYGLSIVHGGLNARWGEFLTYDLTFTHNLFALTPNIQTAMSQMPLQGTGNHFWSIAVEEQFYLIAPLVIVFAPGGRHPALWVTTGICLVFVRQEFSAIALGVAAATMQERRPGFHAGTPARLVIAAALIGSSFWVFTDDLPSYLIVSPLFAICLVLLLARSGRRRPIGRLLGGISYPLYLDHWIALVGVSSLARRLGGNAHVWAVAGMVLAFAIGAGAWWLVDRRVQARRRQWYSPRLGRALALLSYAMVSTGLIVGIHLHGPF